MRDRLAVIAILWTVAAAVLFCAEAGAPEWVQWTAAGVWAAVWLVIGVRWRRRWR